MINVYRQATSKPDTVPYQWAARAYSYVAKERDKIEIQYKIGGPSRSTDYVLTIEKDEWPEIAQLMINADFNRAADIFMQMLSSNHWPDILKRMMEKRPETATRLFRQALSDKAEAAQAISKLEESAKSLRAFFGEPAPAPGPMEP